MAGDADPERHDAAVLGEVHPVDHERHQVERGQVRGKQLSQCMLGHRHELARDRRRAGRARGRGDLLTNRLQPHAIAAGQSPASIRSIAIFPSTSVPDRFAMFPDRRSRS